MGLERASIFQHTDVGKETVEGTAVASLTRFNKLQLAIDPNILLTRLMQQGYRFPVAQVPGKKWSGIIGAASNPCYDELAWIFDWLFEAATPSTPGGGTNSRDRTWTPPPTYENAISTFSVRQGDKRTRAQQCLGAFLIDHTLSWDPDKCDITVNGIGRKFTDSVQMSTNEVQQIAKASAPSAGNFVLTVTNPITLLTATVTIPWNSTAAAIQTLFDTAIGAGNSLVTLGPLPNTAVLVEFQGAYGQVDVAIMTVDNSGVTGGTFVVTTTTPGVAPTETQGIVLTPQHFAVYLDPTFGAIGTTKLTRCYAGSLAVKNVRGPMFVVDRSQAGGLAGKVPLAIDAKVNLTVQGDAQGMGIYASADGANQTQFLRIEAIGNLIEGALFYTLQYDLAVQVSKVNPFKDAGGSGAGIYATDFEFDAIWDSGWQKAMKVFLRNAVSAVA